MREIVGCVSDLELAPASQLVICIMPASRPREPVQDLGGKTTWYGEGLT